MFVPWVRILLSQVLVATVVFTAGAAGISYLADQETMSGTVTPEQLRIVFQSNPDVLYDGLMAVEKHLAAREQASRQNQVDLAQVGDKLFKTDDALVIGNPAEADVWLVEFADYNCGYCRRTTPELERLLERDGRVAVIVRELPVLGQDSRDVARAALAAAFQGMDQYRRLHHALMAASEPLTLDRALAIAADEGLDAAQLREDMGRDEITTIIDNNMLLARAVGVRGTPTFVRPDGQVVTGYRTTDQLAGLIEEVRQRLKDGPTMIGHSGQ